MVSLVLRDPDIMGKDTFGKDRLLKVVKGVNEYIDTYEKAWMKDDETDYYRTKLDDALPRLTVVGWPTVSWLDTLTHLSSTM